MRINITKKDLNPSESTLKAIDKKLGKLDKFFGKDTEANVMLTNMKNNSVKLEATIDCDGLVFRSEKVGNDLVVCLDEVVDKLSAQMSKFKKKLVKRHKNKPGIQVYADELPEIEEAAPEDLQIAKVKTFKLNPMTSDEAILQMEMLGHSFFVYKDGETDSVSVVYKRNDGSYGLLNVEE